MLFDVGTVCVKIAGRDAGKRCVVVDVVDNTYVLIDGETRRKRCNIAHLEPLKESIDVKKGADSAAVIEAFKAIDVDIVAKKDSAKKSAERPKKVHVQKKSVSSKDKKGSKK